ncbi:MAG: hypothetical protein M3N43_05885 [Actinomycetota bacterium]|nr:hypothetical protein [Actinomycetota bacterium]
MFSTNLKRPLLALAVTAGLLAVAGPASGATTHEPNLKSYGHKVAVESFLGIGTTEPLHRVGNPVHAAGAIIYNGHAGLGANWAEAELDANANAVFSGDAYDEMGIVAVPPVRPSANEGAVESQTL